MTLLLILLTLMMLMVIFFDLTSYIIPNWLNGLVLAAYLGLWIVSPVTLDWKSALIATGVMFIGGFAIFALRLMGGGDVKLFIATAPYFGFSMKLLDYLFIVALMGGVLSLVLWVTRKILPFIVGVATHGRFPRILQQGAPVPYGLAIAGAFLYLMWAGNIVGIVPLYQFK